MPLSTRTRPLLTPVFGTALALSLAACGSASGGSGAQTAADQHLSSRQLAAEAKKEGSVTWYTTYSENEVRPVIRAFTEQHPGIKVSVLRLSADQIPPRVITEQRGGKYNADVVSGDSLQVAQLIQAGALQPYRPKDAAALPEGLELPAGYQGVTHVGTTVIAYNPAALKKKGLTPPTSWAELAEPAWKGQFSLDPSAVNWYDSLIATMGHAGALDLMKRLGANEPRFVESHTLSLTQAQSGEPAVAATAYGYKAAVLKKDTPGRLDFVNPRPLPSSLNLVDVAKSAPHLHAAMLFDDWLVSRAGQEAVVDKTNHPSLRTDVRSDPTVWAPTRWKPSWGHPDLPSDQYNKLVQEMRDALKAP